ncbi:MAG: signal peptidase I [Pseudohongiellaceae bacterium]
MKNWLRKFAKDNQSFFVFLILMFVFRSAFADWSDVPTGSMKPTILEGDRIFVNKMAYDIRLPFTHVSLAKRADPVRGDIIVFDSEVSDKRLVKRVVGVPGDLVGMRDNVVSVNNTVLDYQGVSTTDTTIDKIEDLLGKAHQIRVSKWGSNAASFRPVVVPEGFYLALGDNRDNSGDSRMIGFVPRAEIVGKSTSVVLSLNYDNNYLPRSDRFFKSLQ